MISDFQRGELGSVNREWIKKGSSGSQTQLQFSNTVAASVLNRATRVGPPSPIIIEKLRPRTERQEDLESCSSSIPLSVLSEERLQAAVRLARRDLRRRRQESISCLSPEPAETSHNISPQRSNIEPHGVHPKVSGPKKQLKNGAQVLVYTPHEPSSQLKQGQPPTKVLDPRVNSGEPQLTQEIRKLQKELSTYVQRIEQLANKGRAVEVQEPEEKQRMEIRRQEQAARSARIIYVLRQQVKEIQEDLDKLRSQNVKQTQKSRAMDRLAAAHRGAVRAMQVFINQLSDPAENRVPTHCKELGQLIRQLSLCSAKAEVGQGSAVPETALDILQKLETLDSALSKQETHKKRDLDLQNVNPAEKTSIKVRARSMSPPRPARAPAERTSQRPRKPAAAKKPGGSRLAAKSQRTSQALVKERSEVLRAGLESLLHHQKLRAAEAQKPIKPSSVINPNHVKVRNARDASFQQPTVSSRLRENQVPQKEPTVPWVPTSPHSPPRPCTVSSRPEPRCLFSPKKSPEKQKPQTSPSGSTQLSPASHDRNQAQNEALRQAWLDRVTADRLRELNRLSKEETDRINKLRTTVGSPTQWAEKAEQAARERIQPLLDQAKVVGTGSDTLRERLKVADKPEASADVLSEALLEDLLEDAARALWVTERERGAEAEAEKQLQGPTLESMLLRMEEMERDQEEVRRRFAMISYSDPLIWEKGTDAQRNISSSRPVSPQPIRLTKQVLNAPSTANILLQKPVETGAASDTSVLDEESSTLNDPSHPVPAGGGSTQGVKLTVPPSMQRSIQKYRENHDAFLRLVSHEALGSFNPWAIADSLADELMADALADVAAEFQDVCEEYAEAVFTSEFLQPVQSPTTSMS
ncbi:protein moonraker-like isoform X2 [Carassius auratus]|uniref:Protein moonraker-like isoform X2 n=1 Tax=Carassius auratus TaxID=7957 RepID=A0A6P6QX47_CARAU|nr:protein moonraker-like isoform X2 [Carassius auratus]